MKRTGLIFLLCAVMLLAACKEGVTPATEAPRTAAPTTPSSPVATDPTPSKPSIEELTPMLPPAEALTPVLPPVEMPAPGEPPIGDGEPGVPPVDAPGEPPIGEIVPVEPPVEVPAPGIPPVEIPVPGEPPVEAPTPGEPVIGEGEPGYGETPTLTFETYEEYCSYLQTADLPAEFVPYEAIAPLGEFHHFVCLSVAQWGDYSHYMYTLVDDSGTELILYVEYNRNGPEIAPLPLIEDINPENMRQTLSSQRGRYIYEGIEYKYISTGLLSITWEDQGRIFTLSADHLGGYPEGVDTLAARMMDLSQVQEALTVIALPEEGV